MIRSARPEDAAQVAAIYNHYILNTTVTFEAEPVSASDMEARIAGVAAAELPWLVTEESGQILGYAYATPWRTRSAYRHSVEISVYLHRDARGAGLGTALYEALFNSLHSRSIHAVIGGIALPNDASIRLHEKLGMNKVAHFEEVGRKFGRWIDVGYWQRVLLREERD
ncbi:arsinothricin resistance N-acetyltransferase ArsN1 family B [Microbulbifer hainanensis]|uniref:arsinothricin resistance N-acetyltransferase ArsN1 family B n=1 Tax=Microbulbifer hainanensis TaxID=2735675 RepID=UPI001865E74A|nr:arsinothricin resistance N-acetyltransferase ArsN1 family B [Microbulbifer hainanensis]